MFSGTTSSHCLPSVAAYGPPPGLYLLRFMGGLSIAVMTLTLIANTPSRAVQFFQSPLLILPADDLYFFHPVLISARTRSCRSHDARCRLSCVPVPSASCAWTRPLIVSVSSCGFSPAILLASTFGAAGLGLSGIKRRRLAHLYA